MIEEPMMSLAPQEELAIAVRVVEGKCARLRHLISAEKGPSSRVVIAQMTLELRAMELLIAHAKGEHTLSPLKD